MPDRGKVISGLRHCLHYKGSCLDCPYDGPNCQNDVLDDALAMLKEQEPKPIAYTDNPYTGLPVARCPKCGKFARQFHAFTDEETHYCPWCGQEVKWDETN